MNIEENMKIDAIIKFKSREKVFNKPVIFYLGGFASEARDGRYLVFDWTMRNSEMKVDENGYLIVETYLKDFDKEFIESSNEEFELEEINAEFIKNLSLNYIEYECFISTEVDEEINTLLNIEEFSLYQYKWNDRENGVEVEYSKDELDKYNKSHNI